MRYVCNKCGKLIFGEEAIIKFDQEWTFAYHRSCYEGLEK